MTKPAAVPTLEECICSPELAARLIHLLYTEDTEETVCAPLVQTASFAAALAGYLLGELHVSPDNIPAFIGAGVACAVFAAAVLFVVQAALYLTFRHRHKRTIARSPRRPNEDM